MGRSDGTYQDDRALDLVLQLADVSRPVESREHAERRPCNAAWTSVVSLGGQTEQVIGEKGNVLTALP
jgi:hypothetical protein